MVVFFRVFIVMISFVVDIKVRADVSVRIITGAVDIEKNGQLQVVQTLPAKFIEPLDIQTFTKGHVKLMANSVSIGLAEKSFVSLASEPAFEFFQGIGYFKTPHFLTLKTPHGEIETDGGEFLLSTNRSKTTIWVVAGSLIVKDRSSTWQQKIRSGYTSWIGGLLSVGRRAHGELQASEFETVMNLVKHLSHYTSDELQFKYDNYRIVWKDAVETIALETQDKVLDDLKTYAEIQKIETKRQIASEQDNARLRRYYRAKTIGLPDQNEEVP